MAFLAQLDAGGDGIFTGPDAVLDKVIEEGDPLSSSTVTDLAFHRGLNDLGEIAFKYTLDNGVVGIAIAQIPEPTTIALLFAGGATLLVRRRRR